MAELSDHLWSVTVFGDADLGDARLTQRLVAMGQTLAARPGARIPHAFQKAAAIKGAYRLLENRKVSAAPIIRVQAKTAARKCAGLPVVLAVQDTTTLSFNGRPGIEGLGPINDNPKTRGLFQHSTLAFRIDGQPLGLFHLQHWARDPQAGKISALRSERPIEEKESFKWIDGIRSARAALSTLPESQRPRLLHVGDREEDIHEVLAEILAHKEGAVIRNSWDRCVDGPQAHAFQAVRQAPLLGVYELEIPRQRNRARRVARVELRAVSLTLCPNKDKHPQRKPLSLGLVEIYEPHPPPDSEALLWRLWTTEPVATAEQAWAVGRHYSQRWPIEEFHRVLKEGLQAESSELATIGRLSTLLSILSGVAVHLMALRDAARKTPEAPCDILLTPIEWKVLWAKIHGPIPASDQEPPSIRQAVLWIGRLGGHMNRKSDGLPGVKTLWRGWDTLSVLIAGYQLACPSG